MVQQRHYSTAETQHVQHHHKGTLSLFNNLKNKTALWYFYVQENQINEAFNPSLIFIHAQ